MEAEDIKTATMRARVTAAQKKCYKELAQDLGITEADLVRRALADYEQAEIEQSQILAEQDRESFGNGDEIR